MRYCSLQLIALLLSFFTLTVSGYQSLATALNVSLYRAARQNSTKEQHFNKALNRCWQQAIAARYYFNYVSKRSLHCCSLQDSNNAIHLINRMRLIAPISYMLARIKQHKFSIRSPYRHC